MKSKNVALMAVAIGCGLVAAFLTAKLSGGSSPETEDVIVAAKELPVGTLLDEKELDGLVKLQKFPKGTVPPDTVRSVEEIKNKRLNRTLKPGNAFAVGDAGADGGPQLPEGMMKYSVKMDGVKAVAGFVNPGDKVDVLLTESLPNGKAKSGVFLTDMLVLAVDTRSRRSENGEAIQQVNSVSLAVTPKDALTLSSAEKRGEVKLLLRDPKSTTKTHVAAVSKIQGYDDESDATAGAVKLNMVKVLVGKEEVPAGTLITSANFEKYFAMRDVPQEAITPKMITDEKKMAYGRYVVGKVEPDVYATESWFSDEAPKAVEPKVVEKIVEKVVEAPAQAERTGELLPNPKELYPRKFVQIINREKVVFIESAPGEFHRADAADENKFMPPSDGKFKKDDKADVLPGDRVS